MEAGSTFNRNFQHDSRRKRVWHFPGKFLFATFKLGLHRFQNLLRAQVSGYGSERSHPETFGLISLQVVQQSNKGAGGNRFKPSRRIADAMDLNRSPRMQ